MISCYIVDKIIFNFKITDMKNTRIYTFVFIFLLSIGLIAQEPQDIWTLDTIVSGTKAYTAREAIHLGKGFKYTQSSSSTLKLQIDNKLVFPPSANTYAKPDGTITTSPSQGGVVGTIPGQFAVTPTGAATYTIPIEVPPGVNGMQPNISLIYNSQAGDGLLGWGWNLGGFSMISRTTKSIHYDGVNGDIDWGRDSPLMLDGQRLIKNGDSGEYRTENESFCKITGKNISNFVGAEIFEIQTKDGIISEYGKKNDYPSYSAISSLKRLGWRLTKTQDQFGNFIEYYYDNDFGGSFGYSVPIQIQYGSMINGVANRHTTIAFDWVSRNNNYNSLGYIDGVDYKSYKVLGGIEIRKHDANLLNSISLRKYTFEYDNSGYDLLKSIKLRGLNGESYNPTEIKWKKHDNELARTGYADKDVSVPGLEYSDMPSSDPIFADFNGDGKRDMVLINKTTPKITLVLNTSSYDGTKYNMSFTKKNTINFTTNNNNIDLKHVIPAELNGDGMMDLIVVSQATGSYRYNFYLSNGENFYHSGGFNDDPILNNYLIGDFFGKGVDNVLIKSSKKIYSQSSSSGIPVSGINNWADIVFPKQYDPATGFWDIRTFDVTGNGKANIVIRNSNETQIYELRNNNGAYSFVKLFSTTYMNSNQHFVPGDFNGDGKTDLLLAKYNTAVPGNTEYYILFSTGTSFYKKTIPAISIEKVNAVNVIAGDFNLDGKTDVNYIYTDKNDQLKFILGISNGSEFDYQPVVDAEMRAQGGDYLKYVDVGDYTGDGYSDVCYHYYSGSQGRAASFWFFDASLHFRARQINDGLNKTIEMEYRPITDGNVYSENETTALNHTVVKTLFPLYVVDTHRENNNSYSYQYKNIRTHRYGKGFLGFKETCMTDSINHLRITTNYDYNTSFYNVYPVQQVAVRSNASADTISSITYSNKTEDLGIKRIFHYVNKQISKDYLKNTTTTVDIDVVQSYISGQSMDSYCNYGNPSSIKTTIGNWSETQALKYVNAGSWCPNKPQSITTTKTFENQTQTRTKKFGYDNQGSLIKDTTDVNHANQVIVTYSNFDNFGHAKKITTTANGKSRSETLTYTNSGRFLKSRKNDQLDETVTHNYDEDRDILTSKVDRFGTTSYQYDGFGRLKLATYPDGTKTAYALQWAGDTAGKPTGGKYYSYAETSGSSPLITWYDALGREIRKEYYGLNKNKIWVDMQYDAKERLHRVSKPYFAPGSSDGWAETYTYDNYGRTAGLETPRGNTTYAYSGLNTTVSTPSGTHVTTTNPAGWVTSQNVNGKTVTFTHYPSGLVKTSTPQDGRALTMEYDLQGNRTKLIDPDAGTITSAYNGFGELLWTKQKIHPLATDITTDYKYKPAGLLEKITRNGEVTDYMYDSYNRISQISIAGEHRQSFSYDNYDRITTRQEVIGTRSYSTQTAYDALGRVQRETHPSGYFTTNIYDTYGNLLEVRDKDNRLVLKNEEENALGQLKRVTRGNKITTYGYNEKNLLTSINTPGVVDMSYTYSYNGNLSSRKDNLNGYKEEAFYDSRNRLSFTQLFQNNQSKGSTSVTYDNTTGNITKKSGGVSNMVYGEENNKPHALTSLSAISSVPIGNMGITNTDFNKVWSISEAGGKSYSILYGVDEQRRSSVYKTNNVVQTTRYYVGNYEEEIAGSNTRKLHYLPGGAIFIQNNGKDSLLYAYSDYQGSLIALTTESGTVLEKYAYDPWGKRRDPNNWTQADTRTSFKLNRGYTGHEHLDAFGIINMNGRVYDPLTASFFSPDPYIQMPGNWLNYNRYSYCLNNPFLYTDPSGENPLLIALGIYFVFFTDAGYQLQKYVSPVAVHVDVKFGTHQRGIGFDAGVGVPKLLSPVAPWAEYGATYYWQNWGGYQGWETRQGKETTYFGIWTEGETKYKSGEFSQTVGYKKLGIPGVAGVDIYNDLWGDEGDRFRTSRVRLNLFPGINLENVLFTEDPGLTWKERMGNIDPDKGPNGTYRIKNPYALHPEKYRHGVLSLGIGPISIGYDSEKIRRGIQHFIHDLPFVNSPHFEYVPTKKDKFYFQFGGW